MIGDRRMAFTCEECHVTLREPRPFNTSPEGVIGFCTMYVAIGSVSTHPLVGHERRSDVLEAHVIVNGEHHALIDVKGREKLLLFYIQRSIDASDARHAKRRVSLQGHVPEDGP